MLGLLFSTILTSAVDSLNPIAITQQFVLQGMVKRPNHIWYFIIPTGVTNLIGGFLAYYGLVTFIGNFFNKLIEKYGQFIFTAELILGITFLIGVGFLLQNQKIQSLKKQLQLSITGHQTSIESYEAEAISKIKSVSPIALVVLGVGATISELMTALPYFAFLAIIFNYQLTFFQVTFILIVYNTIYTMPLMVLYFIYIKAQDKFDRIYKIAEVQITKLANILAPMLIGIIGIILVYHSISLLLK